MNRSLAVVLASLLLLGLLLASLFAPVAKRQPSSTGAVPAETTSSSRPSIVIYCAASNRGVMDVIRGNYQQEYGTEVQVQYGASQTLLASIEVSETGDLYLPADSSYFEMARQKNLVGEIFPLAQQKAVIAVPKGNPKGIRVFADLLREDVRFIQANPDAAAIGKLTRESLSKQGLWNGLSQHTIAFRSTVTDVANDVKVGAADAGIVFDAVLHTYPDLEPVSIVELQNTIADVAVGIIATSRQPERALHFARYLSAADKGLKRYAEYGFTPVQGDLWEDKPERTR